MLNKEESKVLESAKKLINKVCDGKNHTVGCAVLTKNNKLFYGINMYMDGMNCVCAEQNAVGSALTEGEKDFKAIVAVAKDQSGTFILSPCGQCRQFLSKYAPEVRVIINDNNEVKSVSINELLPYAYKNHQHNKK